MGFLNEDKCNRQSKKMSAFKPDSEADLWCPGIKTLFSDSPKELVKVPTRCFQQDSCAQVRNNWNRGETMLAGNSKHWNNWED